jgi:hypothetical protein
MQAVPSKLTIPTDTSAQTNGYIVIGSYSRENQQVIHRIQDQLRSSLPGIRFWFPRGDQLHITFAHIITPEVTYHKNSTELYADLKSSAIDSLRGAIPQNLDVEIIFDKVEAFPAAIIIKGRDDGSYARMRAGFINKFSLPEQTRKPPEIIHTTIARFENEAPFDEIEKFVYGLNISFTQETSELLLIHEQKVFVQKHEVLERFPNHQS